MDKLRFLDELLTKVQLGELEIREGKESAEQILNDIRNIVLKSLSEAIITDITNIDTGYYAPEHADWKEYLRHINSNDDYARALNYFTEAQLEDLWVSSHIEEELTAEEMQTQVFSALCNLKSLNLVERLPGYKAIDADRHFYIKQQQIARVKGIFNLIFEN